MYVDDGGGGSSGLFLSPVPVPPGDPGALSQAAATYTAAHGEISRGRTTLTSAASQAGGPEWSGTGAGGYITSTNQLAGVYSLTATALAKGAATLRTYSTDLAQAQKTAHAANAAVATSNSSASNYLTAQATAQASATNASDLASTSTTAQAQAQANPHSTAAATAASKARTDASDAQSTASTDAATASRLLGVYQSDYSHAVALCAQATQQAKTAGTKAAAGFNAATTELAAQGKPVAGGANKGATGASAWQVLLGRLATYNDDAGWGLNAWGAFGAVTLSGAEIKYLESQAALGKSVDTFDGAVDGLLAGKGFFGSNYYKAVDDLNAAFKDRRAANADLLEAISPTAKTETMMRYLGRFGLVAGMASDIVTLAEPGASYGPEIDGHHIFGGNDDRGVAAANLVASGLALGGSMDVGLATAALAIPGVNVVVGGVIIATSAYFAGEFVYHHWSTITHGLDDAGSWISHQGSDAEHDISSGWHKLTSIL